MNNRSISNLYLKSKPRGFALLLTLVVVSVIGVVAFGVGRLTLTEFRQTIRFQDSQDALQAAEAGIEDGLVRYRYDRNTEVPESKTSDPYGCGDSTETTQSTVRVLRVDLDAKTPSYNCVDPTKTNDISTIIDPTHHIYDLKVYYKGDSLGSLTSAQSETGLTNCTVGASSGIEVKKDEKVVMSDLPQSDTILVKAPNTSASLMLNTNNYYFLIEYLSTDGLSPTKILYNPGSGNQSKDYMDLTGGLTGLHVPISISTSSMSLKPLEGNICLSAKSEDSTIKIDFGFTFIQSTGYFNGVKRSLTSILNRSSGGTSGAYDYVLFSGQQNSDISQQP